MERTLAFHAAYDGTAFHGWQRQPAVRTVQGVLEDALRRVLRHPLDLVGCSRTDAGVHAAAHVSHVVTSSDLADDSIRHAVGSRLPADLSLLAVHTVHPEFHAQRSAVAKRYRYRIHNVHRRPVHGLTQRYVHHVWHPLDVAAMQAAAGHFLGDVDFTSMAAGSTEDKCTVKTVFRCDVERHLDEIRIVVEGSGFLYKQVRTMAGTLVDVGRGLYHADRVAEILAARDRSAAGPALPGRGLSLCWVRYPARLLACVAPVP